MSKFNIYAQKADKIARKAFKELTKAEHKLREAEEQAKKYPQRYSGPLDAEYAVQSARAQADLLEAREELALAKRNADNYKEQIAAVRQELADALEAEFAADPSAIDTNTMTLLGSGILRPNEYSMLLSKAQAAGNHTMARLISKYATDAAAALEKQYGPDHPNHHTVQELKGIALQGNTDPANSKLDSFGVLEECFERSASNTAMISSWDELTSSVVEEF